MPGGWVTLQDVYRCTVDAELFGRKISAARELADQLCPVRATVATKDLTAHKEPLGEWGWEPVPGTDKAACQLDPALRDRPWKISAGLTAAIAGSAILTCPQEWYHILC